MAGVMTAGPQTGAQKRAGWWVWVSLIGSAFGLMSVFNDLIPNLVRLSLLFKAAVSIYRQGREWVFDGIRWLFSWVNIHIPEIPQLVQDGIIVGALIMAALNLESTRRFRQSLAAAIMDRVTLKIRAISVGYGGAGLTPSLVFSGFNRYRIVADITGALLTSWLLCAIFQRFIPPGAPFSGAVLAGGALLRLAQALLRRATSHWSDAPDTPGHLLARIGLWAVGFAAHIVELALHGAEKGWRAILLAFAIVAAFVGLNAAFAQVIDPLIAQGPPAWLQELIDADPQVLREENPR